MHAGLGVSAALNSTFLSSYNPFRLCFHVVTDAASFPAFVVWFSRHPPGSASLEVRRVEGESGWLNASFAPVLRQMQDAGAKSFYFSAAAVGEASDPIKFRNPKYMSLLNHLRFYLPLLFPALHRILFLDDDVIVQRDLSALYSLDMNGCVRVPLACTASTLPAPPLPLDGGIIVQRDLFGSLCA
ncbi:unnamed protein product [Closterium sp. NIES-54]